MNAKLQLAYDDAYIDFTNLKSKLQKHLAFEAELQASADRVESLRKKGENLIAEGNFDSVRVEAQLNEMIEGWNEINKKSSTKTTLLQNAYKEYQTSRKLASFDKWLDYIEQVIGSNDHGEDIASVEQLIKRHEEVVNDVEAKRQPIREVVEKAEVLLNSLGENETIADQLLNSSALLSRYESLAEPCQIRAENLRESLKFYQWKAEVDEQISWINDKLPQMESTNYGQTLHAAQSLNKKHHIFEEVFIVYIV